MENNETTVELPPHVLIFPVPLQGHINSMLKLAELLCFSKIHVTMILSYYANSRIDSVLSHHSSFRIATISDGLPDNYPRVGERSLKLVMKLREIGGFEFRRLIESTDCLSEIGVRRRVSCLIMDGVLSFCVPVVKEMGIPFIYFRTISACSFWTYFCMEDIVDAGEFPFIGKDEDAHAYWKKKELDSIVTCLPGVNGFLRQRDIPRLGRIFDFNDPLLQAVVTETRMTASSSGLILNTFEELEGPVLDEIRKHIPNLYTIGPLHTQLKSRLDSTKSKSMQVSSSFLKEDRGCLTWLDSQASNSVIYVSFGSITILARNELLEIWYGLVNSGQKFLWVMRPDSIIDTSDENKVPLELEEATKERGYMVEWVPQHEVLAHSAVAVFFTHSGWNSTLESIAIGKPMICWPYFADQMINSRFVSDMWKCGLDMKDTCDRVRVEKVIRDVMDLKRDEFLERARNMAVLANKAVSDGGSSTANLNQLIEFIKSSII